MSYYAQEQWQNASRQASWEHTPSRSGASSSAGGREESLSFVSQIEEVERAIENLSRSGKLIPGGNAPFRRDPALMGGPPRPDYGPNSRHQSGEFEPHRQHPASNVQGFYQNQRYGPRKTDTDGVHQTQRRMAAARERELRNYHQEQQYNRGSGKPERSLSPNMSEEERRDLIARQHRALYGDEGHQGPGFPNASQDPRGPSPMAAYPSYGPDGAKSQPPSANPNEAAQHGPSPQPHQGGTPPQQQGQQQVMRTSSSSSPKNAGQSSPPRHAKSNSVAPIGTRPAAGSISQAAKRSTPPASSPLGISGNGNERSGSAASNVQSKDTMSSGWNNGNGGWANTNKNPLGVQASVWG